MVNVNETQKVEFPDPQDTSVFNISVTPQDGYWKNATFVFSATVPLEYPHSPPAIVLKVWKRKRKGKRRRPLPTFSDDFFFCVDCSDLSSKH